MYTKMERDSRCKCVGSGFIDRVGLNMGIGFGLVGAMEIIV